MIEVGNMTGTGTAAATSAAAHVGVQLAGAVDEGAFRASLKASVGAAMSARTVALNVPVVARVAGTLSVDATQDAAGLNVAKTGATATVAPEVLQASVVVTSPVGRPVVEEPGGVADVLGAKVGSEDGAGSALLQRSVGAVAGAVREAGALAKPVESAVPAVAGARELKDGAGVLGKRIAGKSAEHVVATPGPESAAVAVAEGAGASAAMVAVPLVAPVLLVPVAVGATDAGPTQTGTAAAGGSEKVAKVGSPTGTVKAAGRDGKKVEGSASIVGKAGPGTGTGTGFVLPVAASGGGHAGKDGVAVPGALNAAGTVAVVGVVTSHAGVVGVAGGKVAANVERVSSAGGQGSGVASGPEVKTLAATPNLLEVGIDGGTHGWLRVRAEMAQTGEVTASMVASSAGQADTLRRELPAISTYLAGESVGVSSLVVNAAGGMAGAQDAAMSLGAGAQGSGPDGRAQQGSLGAQGGEAISGPEGVAGLDFGGAEMPAAVYANGSGGWLSVRV